MGGMLLVVFNDDELLTPKGVEVLLELSAMAKGFSSTTRAKSWVQAAYATRYVETRHKGPATLDARNLAARGRRWEGYAETENRLW